MYGIPLNQNWLEQTLDALKEEIARLHKQTDAIGDNHRRKDEYDEITAKIALSEEAILNIEVMIGIKHGNEFHVLGRSEYLGGYQTLEDAVPYVHEQILRFRNYLPEPGPRIGRLSATRGGYYMIHTTDFKEAGDLRTLIPDFFANP